ncbi:MAG: alpha/beta hydrolase [Alphaproteobacteria bacterium]|nr:alpha/beta hydrolase [Alphaproteobacteria bacterium]
MYDYFPNNYNWSLALYSVSSMGLPLSFVGRVASQLSEFSDPADPRAPERWYQTWMSLGSKFESAAQEDHDGDRLFSAGAKFRRASLCYFMANRMMSHHDARQIQSYNKGVEAFAAHLQAADEPAELIDVPYQDTSLPAVLSKAPGDGAKPCMVHFDGFDFLKEFNYTITAEAYRKRGVSVLYVDHPGVGGALRLRGLTSFPESEIPAGAAVDYLEGRADIDAARIGMVALSLGGYYASRAAAYEKRLKCCIAWGALYDFEEIANPLVSGDSKVPSVTNFQEHLMWVFGKDTVAEAMEIAKQFNLRDVVKDITVPYLIVHGENDRQVPMHQAEASYNGAVNSPRRELKVFSIDGGACEHCHVDDFEPAADYMADWAADILKATPVRE